MQAEDLTLEQAEHAMKLLGRVNAGLMTLQEAALILRITHPELGVDPPEEEA